MRLVHEAGLVRVRECRHGVMAYLRSDEHVGRSLDVYGEWAEAEIELLTAFLKPGDVVVDVGANHGTHSLAFAKKVGPTGALLAFEPQRVVHQLLCANLMLNGVLHARALHAAVGAAPGALLVPDIDYAAAGNFGGLGLGAWEEGESVPVLTLDGFELPRLAVLKLDVEGMEALVLRGAAQTVTRCQPVLYVENNQPAGAPEVVEQLLRADYSLHWHFSPFFRAANFAGVRENVFGPTVDANMLCLPKRLAGVGAPFLSVEGPLDTAAKALSRKK